MGGQSDGHGIVHVCPFRMMLHALRLFGNLIHPLPRLHKIHKVKCFGDSVATRNVLNI
jgi:hypothetical protein